LILDTVSPTFAPLLKLLLNSCGLSLAVTVFKLWCHQIIFPSVPTSVLEKEKSSRVKIVWNNSCAFQPEIPAQGRETYLQCVTSQVIFTAHFPTDAVGHMNRNAGSQFHP
jgi:hypothetical protein